MPVLLTQAHPLSLGINILSTGRADLAMVHLPAPQAVRLTLYWDILLTCQGGVTQPAAEMFDVPECVLCTCVLCREYQLITGSTPWDLHQLGIVPPTVQLALVVVVQQVLQHLPTTGAGEAGRVPTLVSSCPLCKDSNLPWEHFLATPGTSPALVRSINLVIIITGQWCCDTVHLIALAGEIFRLWHRDYMVRRIREVICLCFVADGGIN